MKTSLKKWICFLTAAVMITASAVSASAAASAGSSSSGNASAGTSTAVKSNGEIYVLCTSDAHCGIDQGFGYAGLQQVRQTLEAQGYETILIDNGDAVQGEPIGMLSKGEALIIISTSRSTDNIKLSLNANEASGAKCTSSPARNLFAKSEINEHLFAIRPSVCHMAGAALFKANTTNGAIPWKNCIYSDIEAPPTRVLERANPNRKRSRFIVAKAALGIISILLIPRRYI